MAAPSRPNLRPRRWSAAALARETARHARFVGIMKLALPLAAAALVVLVVSWPYLAPREEAGLRLTFAKQGKESDGQITMSNARYVGTDRKAQPFTITAEQATQDPDTPDRLEFRGIEADITLTEGTWLALRSERGRYDRERQILELLGDVTLFTDDGYELRTRDISIDLDKRTASGDQPLHAQGALGLIEAGGFRATDAGMRVRFLGPVRMTLYPAAGG